MSVWISPEFFEVNLRPPNWPDDPDLRRAVDWFTSFMSDADWRHRRFASLERFINGATGNLAQDPTGAGRFFSADDQFAWYLFLGQAWLDHPTVYDFTFGSRVLPLLRAIGRSLELLKGVEGVGQRVQRMVGPERRQPNGALFELLVAAAYRREGADVRFLPEHPGVKKTHDMDVRVRGREWAVECKRMEIGEYTERERARARELWLPTAHELQQRGLNVLAKVQFTSELHEVSSEYLARHAVRWMAGGLLHPHQWQDRHGSGTIGLLDMTPLKTLLKTDDVAIHGSRMRELLTGRYKRNAKVIQVLHARMADNPLYVEVCDQAIVLDWESQSPGAIDGKARDVLKRLADGALQLPDDRPGVVHIGLEAVDGDEVEKVRYEKVINTVSNFDARGKPLQHMYVSWFTPESPPNSGEAFDETCHWAGMPGHLRPLQDDILVLPPGATTRRGVHWD
jgi:hypothetical protein